MTTKNFNQMATKKLNALLATASDEDKMAIEAVLAAREQAQAFAAANEVADETTAATNEVADETTAAEKKKHKMTDEERHALAERLKANINHRCQVVPFNTIDWVDGYIAGVVEEKRSNKVLYAVKTDDGRRIVKVHDSALIKVLDEVVKPEKRARVRKANNDVEKVKWTPEAIAEEINKVAGNVGRLVKFEKYRAAGENGEERAEMISGRITTIVPDKRTQRLFYCIVVPTPTESDPLAVKAMHKVVTSESLQIAEEFDAEGQELNVKYRARREAAAARTPLTPQDRVIHCEESLKKAEEKLQKATEELETKKKQLEEAKAELNAYFAAQAGESSESSESSESAADPLA